MGSCFQLFLWLLLFHIHKHECPSSRLRGGRRSGSPLLWPAAAAVEMSASRVLAAAARPVRSAVLADDFCTLCCCSDGVRSPRRCAVNFWLVAASGCKTLGSQAKSSFAAVVRDAAALRLATDADSTFLPSLIKQQRARCTRRTAARAQGLQRASTRATSNASSNASSNACRRCYCSEAGPC